MCGIFGIITPGPKEFDFTAFSVLGIENDSRGGDSCGIFIDGEYEYGVGDKKLFSKFFKDSKLLNAVKTSQIALGHCRKASVGAINEANAQPVIIKKDGKVEYVLIHNGTIINYVKLAHKYIPEMNIKHLTDSQVMAHIFYNAGYDVLAEYTGAGVFVMVDYREEKPRVFMFKGESKHYQHSPNTTIERPLFCTYTEEEFIFSSLPTYLEALRPGQAIYDVLSNHLVEIKDGEPIIITKYNREEAIQIQSTTNIIYYNDNSRNYPRYNNSVNTSDTIEIDAEGVFLINHRECHGPYWVTPLGDIGYYNQIGSERLWFFGGALLKNEACFRFLVKFCRDMGVTYLDLIRQLPDLVYFFSPFPYVNEKNKWVFADTPSTNKLYSGIVKFPFCGEEICIKKGKLEWINPGVSYSESFNLLSSYKNYTVDIDAVNAAFN